MAVSSGAVEKETSPEAIMGYGVMSTPAVVVDEKVVHSESIPHRADIEGWLRGRGEGTILWQALVPARKWMKKLFLNTALLNTLTINIRYRSRWQIICHIQMLRNLLFL